MFQPGKRVNIWGAHIRTICTGMITQVVPAKIVDNLCQIKRGKLCCVCSFMASVTSNIILIKHGFLRYHHHNVRGRRGSTRCKKRQSKKSKKLRHFERLLSGLPQFCLFPNLIASHPGGCCPPRGLLPWGQNSFGKKNSL